jgi:hypothetical protein
VHKLNIFEILAFLLGQHLIQSIIFLLNSLIQALGFPALRVFNSHHNKVFPLANWLWFADNLSETIKFKCQLKFLFFT